MERLLGPAVDRFARCFRRSIWHFSKDCPRHPRRGKTGSAWWSTRISRPTSSFAYLARDEYRVIFVGRSNRGVALVVAKEKLRGTGSQCLEAGEAMPPMSVICYPRASALQIVAANPGCGNPACNYHLRVACCGLRRTNCYAIVVKRRHAPGQGCISIFQLSMHVAFGEGQFF